MCGCTRPRRSVNRRRRGSRFRGGHSESVHSEERGASSRRGGAAWCDPYQSVGDEQFNVSPTHSCLCTQRSLVTPPRSRDELGLRERKLSQQGQRTSDGWWPAFERVWCDEEGTA